MLPFWFCRPLNCFSCSNCVNCPGIICCKKKRKLTIMYFTLSPFSLPPFLSSLFSRAFFYDHKNRKCQWLSFDRNSPGTQTQQDFNYQLYQKKGALDCCTFTLYLMILQLFLFLSPALLQKKENSTLSHFQSATSLQCSLVVTEYVGKYIWLYEYTFSEGF